MMVNWPQQREAEYVKITGRIDSTVRRQNRCC